MSMQTQILIGIILFALAAFVFEWLPIDVVALVTLSLLLVFNLVTPEEALSGFSNKAVITVMMMFVLSYGLTHSGLISKLGNRIASYSGLSYWRAAATLLVLGGSLSAFINNTAALALLIPLGIQLTNHYKQSPSRILLPLSYISIIGGTCTLFGTSTNLLVGDLAEIHGLAAIGVFDFLGLGVILMATGLVYIVLVPMRFLPQRQDSSSLTSKYRLSAFLTEVSVPKGSRLIGRTVVDEKLHERFQLNVLEIRRGNGRIRLDLRSTPIVADDLLILRGAFEDIVAFKEQFGLLMLTDVKLSDADLGDESSILAEIQLSPVSRLRGLTVREIDFRRRYGCFVLALNRTGAVIRDKLASIPIRQWDTLLVFGPRPRVEGLYELDDFVPLQELKVRLRLAKRWWVSVVVIPLVILLAALQVMPIVKAAILGMVVLVVFRALTIQQAYEAINWTVIFLLAAIIPLGIAMEKTGLAVTVGQTLARLGESHGSWVVLALVYLVTALLSEVVSNNSTSVLMVPIALTTAETLGLPAKPFVMAVAYAASASFLTPMGYQTNAMVYGPGGYRFRDYLVFGAPLKLSFWVLSVALIPVFWPFDSQ